MQKNLRLVGTVSAIAVGVMTVWFMVAFALYAPSIMKWQGIEAFAGAFHPVIFEAWVLPCLLLALSFPILAVCILLQAPVAKRLWGVLGAVFATMYGAILTTDYFLLLTVVRQSLMDGNLSGLDWLIVGSPHSITNTIEGAGYMLMGAAFLFQGLCFGETPLERWVRVLLLTNGGAGVVAVVVTVTGFVAGSWISLGIWGITFPAIMALLAVHFGGGNWNEPAAAKDRE